MRKEIPSSYKAQLTAGQARQKVKEKFSFPNPPENAKDCEYHILVGGYSWGAWEALRFANQVSNDSDFSEFDVRIHLGLLDPVDQFRLQNHRSPPSIVKSGINVYQTTGCLDCIGLPSNWFKGSSVGSPVNNIDYSGLPGRLNARRTMRHGGLMSRILRGCVRAEDRATNDRSRACGLPRVGDC
jgi:hypothetical protein